VPYRVCAYPYPYTNGSPADKAVKKIGGLIISSISFSRTVSGVMDIVYGLPSVASRQWKEEGVWGFFPQ